MAKESEFIDKLSNFTTALEELVELLKEQQKISPTEVVNQLLENIDGKAIAEMAKQIKEIHSDTSQLVEDNKKILRALKDAKKEKESGMFGEVDDNKNKNKIIDGVKTIILIAAGVLAIGLAFKIIGKVDFFSVIALGLAIGFIAVAFAVVASLKDKEGKPITWKQVLFGAATMVIMATSLLIAGLILKLMPTLSLQQLISATFVALAIGGGTFLILKSLKGIDPKSLFMLPLIPIMVPLVAMGIVLAGFILKSMPVVGFQQILSALLVSIALAPMALAFGFMVKGLKNAKMTDILFVGLAIPVMAFGIVAASWILMLVSPMSFGMLVNIVLAGLAVGIATLFLVPTIWLLSKSGLLNNIKNLGLSVVAIVLISTAIALSSWVLSFGNYKNAPSWKWSLGVGLSILAFTPSMILVGLFIMTGAGLPALILATIGILLISTAIMLSSHILSLGNYDKYPGYEWSLGVGLSMITFGLPMLGLGVFILSTVGLGLLALVLGAVAVVMIASTIVGIDSILSSGDYSKFPSFKWSTSVGLALLGFGMPMMLLGSFILSTVGLGLLALMAGSEAMYMIADTIVNVSNILSNGNYTGGPTKDWALGVGYAIVSFATAISILSMLNLLDTVLSIFGLGSDHTKSLLVIAQAMVDVAGVFARNSTLFDEKNVPSKKWAQGIGLSLKYFAQAISALDEAGVDIDADDLEDDDGAVAIMKGLSYGIIEVAKIFNDNKVPFNEDNLPGLEWGKRIGKALNSFANVIKTLEESGVDPIDIAFGLFGFVIRRLSTGIIDVAEIFNNNKIPFSTSNMPDDIWIEQISNAMMSFSKIVKNLEENYDFEPLFDLASAIVSVADKLKDLNSYTDLFANGGVIDRISFAIGSIISVLPTQEKIDPLWSLIEALEELSHINWFNLDDIDDVSQLISNLSKEINNINSEKIDSLVKLSAGLHIMSLVDQTRLKQTLDILDEKSDALSEIMDEGGLIQNVFSGIKNVLQGKSNETTNVKKQTKTEKNTFEEELLLHVKNIDKNMTQIANSEENEKEKRLKGKNVEEEKSSWSLW